MNENEIRNRIPHKCADCEEDQRSPILAIVSESATHVAFVNGKTYTREEIVRAVNAYAELLNLLNEIRDFHSGGLPSEFVNRLDKVIAKAEGCHE